MELHKTEYIRKERKKLLVSLTLLVCFGTILYATGMRNKNKPIKEEALSGGLFDIAKKLDSENTSENRSFEKSSNILQTPLSVPFVIENDKIFINESLKIAKREIHNGIFFIKEHGNTIYSTDFTSNDSSIYCKGTMKKGGDRFFIYFCEKRNRGQSFD